MASYRDDHASKLLLLLCKNLLGYCETSDIYSLGVSACEMANGIVPYSDFPPTLMMIEKLR